MSEALIEAIECRTHTAPLPRPWGADVPTITVIEVEVATGAGTGTGMSWTPSIGAAAVRALLENDIASFVVGQAADPRSLWPRLWRHLHEAGSGGITTMAMAGVDLALWDLEARSAGKSLASSLGRHRASVPVYGSGVNLHYPIDELVDQAGRWVQAGYPAVKVKVGKPDLAEDVERIGAVREVIGPDRGLMIDANQRWDLDTATEAIGALSGFNLTWVEEPLLADDLEGHVELRSRIDVPVAIGENLRTRYAFDQAIRMGACDIVQPNIVRVGGVTPFLEIAALAADREVPLYPHLLPELSGQLALSIEQDTMVEEVEDAGLERIGIISSPSPVVIDGGELREAGTAGLGLLFRRD